MRYKVVLKLTDEGYSVSCPGLPGCWSQGATEAEAIENIRDVIAEYRDATAATLVGEDLREVEVAEERDASPYHLTDGQVADVERRLADPNPNSLTLDEVRLRLAPRCR